MKHKIDEWEGENNPYLSPQETNEYRFNFLSLDNLLNPIPMWLLLHISLCVLFSLLFLTNLNFYTKVIYATLVLAEIKYIFYFINENFIKYEPQKQI